MEIAIGAARWVVGRALGPVRDGLLESWAASSELGPNVRTLKLELLYAEAVLDNARGREVRSAALGQLLLELRHQAYKADDVLDELEYFRIHDELHGTYETNNDRGLLGHARHTARAAASKLKIPSCSCARVCHRHRKPKFDRVEMSKRMAEIVEQLKPVCAKVATILDIELLGLIASNITTSQQGTALSQTRDSTPEIIEPQLYGRDGLKKDIVDGITQGKYSANNLTVLSIVGPGGLGKTKLMQHIYDEVKNQFQVPVWICVSQNNFSANRLAQEIIQKIPKGDNEKENASAEELIEKRLQSKQFLLVLDDMWTYHEGEWERLLAPFRKGGTEACVFGDQQSWEQHKNLHHVGLEIVRKLKGFPLAVKTVSRLLKNDITLEYWTRVLDSQEWESEANADDIMPALRLSYNYLPFNLQQCYSHCALFPEDYEFASKELVHLWIGLGLLGSDNQNKRIEDTGLDYLKGLVNHGFFQEEKKKDGHTSYVIHDLLHDLAVSVSAYECLSLKSSNLRSIHIPASIRHLSITIEDEAVKDRVTFESCKNDLYTLGKRLKAENLRTLILFGDYHESFCKPFGDIFGEAKALRVIFLSQASYDVENLLYSFSKLVHLRYLRIEGTIYNERRMSSSIARFYNLLVLDIEKSNYSGSTREISNLVKIRHVDVADDMCHFGIYEVGKLKSIQELRRFEVKREDHGFELNQLGQLPQLHGSLEIYNLEKDIQYKKNQQFISVRFRMDTFGRELWNLLAFSNLSDIKEFRIRECPALPLDHLQLLSSVKTLRMYNCSSVLWPTEAENKSQFKFPVEHLTVDKCCVTGKELAQLISYFPNLSKLQLWDCDKQESGAEETKAAAEGLLLMPLQINELLIIRCADVRICSSSLQSQTSLTSLTIWDCPKLLSTSSCSSSYCPFPTSLQNLELGGVKDDIFTLTPLSNLTKLELSNCECLRSEDIWHLLAQGHLRELEIQQSAANIFDCSEAPRIMQALETDGEAGYPAAVPIRGKFSSSLTKLRFVFPDLEHFTRAQSEALQLLTSLQELRIYSCCKLQSLPAGLSGLPNLKSLWIIDCESIRSLPKGGLPSSLIELKILDCLAIRSRPKGALPSSLIELRIWRCPVIRSLPKGTLPSSLMELNIYNCSAFRSLPKDSLPSSLTKLVIENCPAIRSLHKDRLPSSLQTLDVSSSNEKLQRQCRKLKGIIPIVITDN
ncbi:hypothetical protein EJB05_01651, partial [Eragrostis curvula]